MIAIIFLFSLALIWILFASIQDLRQREVANWLNFSLIIFALGFRFLFSLFSGDLIFFYEGLIGLGIFAIIGNLLYYGKMFGGGDAKLMIALGPIIPFSGDLIGNVSNILLFLLVFFAVAAVYSIIFSLYHAIKNFKKFKKEISSLFNEKRKLIYGPIFLGLILMILGYLDIILFILGIFVFILPYLYIYAKAVDEASMVKKVFSKDLVEGDILYKNIRVGKHLINANWNGLKKKEISLIKKHKKFVWTRQGIPFIPVFLISFIIFIWLYFKGFSLTSALYNLKVA